MSFNSSKINLNINTNPYIFLKDSVSSFSYKILIMLFLQFIMLCITKSYGAISVIFTSFMGGLCAASVYYLIFKGPVYYSTMIVVYSLFIGFLLPSTYPVLAVFFLSFFTLLIFKLFEHKNNPWLNPVAIAVIIAWLIGKQYFPDFLMNYDLIVSKNPSFSLISQGTFPIHSFDSGITGFLNNYIFSFFKVSIPEGFISLLWDTNSIIPAFRFNLLTILASIFLFSDNYLMSIIPYAFILIYSLLVRLFAPFIFGGNFNSGDIILALLTSGTLFTSVFLMQLFGTIPVMPVTKIIFGIIAGITAFLVTGCGTSPIGMMYTVVICNLFNLPLCYLENKKIKKNYSRLLKPQVSK